MKFVNLTPHPVRFRFDASNEPIAIETDLVFEPMDVSHPARIDSVEQDAEPIDGMPVTVTVFGDIYDLPEQQEGIVLIVSLPVVQKLAGSRPDVVAPHTGPKGGAIRVPGSPAPYAVRRWQRF